MAKSKKQKDYDAQIRKHGKVKMSKYARKKARQFKGKGFENSPLKPI